MNSNQKEFIEILRAEYPNLTAVDLVAKEMVRLSRRHRKLQENACNFNVPENHDAQCEGKITKLCDMLPGCTPIFSGDPRGCTVKLKLPSKRTNDWGQTGICVPQ